MSRADRRETWVLAAVLCVFACLWEISRTFPPLPQLLTFRMTLPPGEPQRIEPIVSAGMIPGADFLYITYESANEATFTYQSWENGLISPRLTYRAGVPMKVELEMPALADTRTGPAAMHAGQVRLRLDGLEIFNQPASWHRVDPTRIFFGENAVGWKATGVEFRGRLETLDGRLLRGGLGSYFTYGARCAWWLRTRAWHVLPWGMLTLGLAWLGERMFLGARRPRPQSGWVTNALVTHRVFLIGAALSLWVFVWLLTGARYRFIFPDEFGAFYDFQAQSLLEGRLDVPYAALGSEAFVFHGKSYGYFGPTPALLRIPFAIGGVGFGHLTRSFMVADYAVILLGAYLLLWWTTQLLRGPAARPSGGAVALMITGVGCGSTLLFMASRAYVYHEAILCGVAFATWSTAFSLRYLTDPRFRWWGASLACGVLSIQSRPPVGLYALTLLGCIALAHVISAWRKCVDWRKPFLVGALSVGGFLTLPAIAYLKFGTFHGNPVHLNEQYTPARLAKIEGKSFHLSNFHHNLDTYFLRPGLRSGARFPFFIFDMTERDYPGAKMDLNEKTAGILYAMSGLSALALLAGFAAWRERGFREIALIAIGATLPLLGCMLTFIATTHRYTADFCPALFLGSAVGLAFLDQQTGWWRRGTLAAAAGLIALSCVIQLGISFHFRVEGVWGVPEELRNHFLETRAVFDRWFPGTPP